MTKLTSNYVQKKLPDLERHGSGCISCGAAGPERIATTKHHHFLN
jgi:hypothetical protein